VRRIAAATWHKSTCWALARAADDSNDSNDCNDCNDKGRQVSPDALRIFFGPTAACVWGAIVSLWAARACICPCLLSLALRGTMPVPAREKRDFMRAGQQPY
jgi:hypothetical protein